MDDKSGAHSVALAPLAVSTEIPIVVSPPLRGDWIAGDSVNNRTDAAHRRAVLVDNGHAWLAQRYAIDWVQYQTVDGVRTTWKGPEARNDSYFCYDQPIYSVAPGKVVEATDGLPENVPISGKYAIPIDFNNAAGNHVVVEIAPSRYVLYAHMRPGTWRQGWRCSQSWRYPWPRRQYRKLDRSAFAHAHRRSAVISCRQRRAERVRPRQESGAVEANVSSPTAISLGTDHPSGRSSTTIQPKMH